MTFEARYFNSLLLIKCSLLLLVLSGLFASCGRSKSDEIIIYNGFSQNVNVQLAQTNYALKPESHIKVDINYHDSQRIVSIIMGDTVDDFIPKKIVSDQKHVYNIGYAAAFYESEIIYEDTRFGDNYLVEDTKKIAGAKFEDHSSYAKEPETNLLGAPRWFSTKADYILVEAPEEIEVSSLDSYTNKWQLSAVSDVNPRSSLGWILEGAEHISEMLTANATFCPENDPNFIEWISYASYLDPDLTAVKSRLEKNPKEVASNRLLMDGGTNSEKSETCAEILKLIQTDANNADLHYLKCRCIEDNNEKNKALKDAFNLWSTNGWLGHALGHIHANNGNWKKSMEAYSVAMTYQSSLANSTLPMIYRIYMHTGELFFQDAYLFDSNDDISYYRALATGDASGFYDTSDAFYSQLLNKRFGDAAETISNSYDASYQKLLFDLSTNAPDNYREELMNSDEYIDSNGDEFFIAAAFSAKYNIDLSRGSNWNYALEEFGIDKHQFESYMKALKSKENSELSIMIDQLSDDFVLKLKFKLMARIAFEGKIPDTWKKEIDDMLYVNEKPVLN